MKAARTPLRLAGLLLSLACAAAGAQGEGKKQEFRTTDPPWVTNGQTTLVRIYGEDLAPTEIRFADAGLIGKVLKTEPWTPKKDEDKSRGNTVVEAEITLPAGLSPRPYRFKLVGEGCQPAEGQIFVDVAAPEITETEPNDSLRKPQPLPPGSVTVTGKLDNEGVDVFRIDGKAGETWRFEVFARRLNRSTKLEPVLRLRDPRMAPVRAAVDHGEDCFVEYRLPVDGPYLLELFDGDNKSGADQAYRLAVRKLPSGG